MKKNLLYVIGGLIAFCLVLLVLRLNRTCIVTFDTSGGTIYASENVKCGNPVNKPNDPVMDGYKFVEWYDAATNTIYDFNKPVEKDITIKARYNKID